MDAPDGVEALSTAELFTLILRGNGAANARQREKALQLIQRLLAERNTTAAILGTDVYELFAAEFDDRLAYRLVALLELYRRASTPGRTTVSHRLPKRCSPAGHAGDELSQGRANARPGSGYEEPLIVLRFLNWPDGEGHTIYSVLDSPLAQKKRSRKH